MKKSFIYFAALFAVVMLSVLGCKKDTDDVTIKQGAIYGIVTDFATGDPVYNANVQLRPSGGTTLTDLDGSYQFNDLNAQQYTITVQMGGYRTDRKSVNLVAGEKTEVTFALHKE